LSGSPKGATGVRLEAAMAWLKHADELARTRNTHHQTQDAHAHVHNNAQMPTL